MVELDRSAALQLAAELGRHFQLVPDQIDIGTKESPTPERGLIQTVSHVNRQNFFTLLACLETDHVFAAAQLSRSLLEESIRWEWMTDNEADRIPLLFGNLQDNIRKISKECQAIGLDPRPFLEPSPIWHLGATDLTTKRRTTPGVEQMLREIQVAGDSRAKDANLAFDFDFRALYAQYRVLCQFTHTSILGMIATVQIAADGSLSVGQDLPDAIWALVLHSGAASAMTVAAYTAWPFQDELGVHHWTKAGYGISFRIAEALGPVHGLVP